MINITLEGILGEKLGKTWELDVKSIIEIFEAIEANTSDFSKYSRDLQKTFNHFVVYLNNKLVPARYLCAKILRHGDNIKILPIIKGSDFGLTLFIIGLLLMVLSVVISIVFSPKAAKDVKTASSSISGIKNVLNRNICIPIGYGRFKIGSAIISNLINTRQLALSNISYGVSYGGSAGGGDNKFIPYVIN
jgi:predicted phage tail protein